MKECERDYRKIMKSKCCCEKKIWKIRIWKIRIWKIRIWKIRIWKIRIGIKKYDIML
ncbi:MAG: hypothetical protein ACTSRP_25750 [Candidatus Helarchaeota archaeon]